MAPQPQQGKLIVYLIMILGLVLGFLYTSGSDPTASVPALDLDLQVAALQGLQDAHIDDTIRTADTFTSLQVFGSLPVQTTAGGKSDPFQ